MKQFVFTTILLGALLPVDRAVAQAADLDLLIAILEHTDSSAFPPGIDTIGPMLLDSTLVAPSGLFPGVTEQDLESRLFRDIRVLPRGRMGVDGVLVDNGRHVVVRDLELVGDAAKVTVVVGRTLFPDNPALTPSTRGAGYKMELARSGGIWTTVRWELFLHSS